MDWDKAKTRKQIAEQGKVHWFEKNSKIKFERSQDAQSRKEIERLKKDKALWKSLHASSSKQRAIDEAIKNEQLKKFKQEQKRLRKALRKLKTNQK